MSDQQTRGGRGGDEPGVSLRGACRGFVLFASRLSLCRQACRVIRPLSACPPMKEGSGSSFGDPTDRPTEQATGDLSRLYAR